MDVGTLISKVRKLEIAAKGLTRHLFSGTYHAAFKGKGMSFSEVRSYTYGDDVRSIDWNVTARTLETHVKIFEEERELTVVLLIDLSASSFFGSGHVLKHELITEIAALLAYSAISNQDKAGAVLFTDRIESYIPPRKGRMVLFKILRALINRKNTSEGTGIGHALQYLYNIEKKRCIVFLLSDFIDHNFEQALTMVAKKHDVIGVHISDNREKKLADMGLVRFMDAETGVTRLVDTGDVLFRAEYSRIFSERSEYLQEVFRKAGADLICISDGDDYVKVLAGFFKRRSGR
jgi:uncharacterized protein (DUF58 family)